MATDPDIDANALRSSRMPTVRETALGMTFMLGAFFFYSTSDMLAKVLTQSMHPVQVAWTRQLGLLAVVVFLLVRHGGGILRTQHPTLQISRGLTAVVTVTCFIFAVAYVPLADAVAVSFVAPFAVTVLAALILGETVGLRRWVAVAIGFAGTLVVIRPGAGVFHPAIFLVLIAATGFALRQVLSRMLSSDEPLATTIAYTGLTASLVLTLPLPFVWSAPTDWQTVAIMAGSAFFAGLAEVGIIRALDLTLAVIVAPLQYSLMIWSTIWGFLIFSQLPDGWTLAGAAVIMASGVYTFVREARATGR